jgi:prolyl-tRNA editing enzyme YbaK/EbsC (Cys-tRNA(Pro) deacylase)
MWPEPVERVAAFLRSAGAPARLEELPADADSPPGPALRAAGFDCDGRSVVAVVPADRAVDRDKVAAAAGCTDLRPAPPLPFPFQSARVFLDRAILFAGIVWLEAGSPRHVVGLAPAQLARLTRAETADLLQDAGSGEVGPRGPG